MYRQVDPVLVPSILRVGSMRADNREINVSRKSVEERLKPKPPNPLG
jgi:hypothetical protein